MFSDNPVYNIKVVLRETGVKADVLRAWERRYGLPKPQRSSGGHRQYSQHDIAMVKWLIARQNEGLSISSAVELWREIEAESHDPLAESSEMKTTFPLALSALDSNVAAHRQKWLDACMAFNEPTAEQVLNQAFSLYPVERVVSEVIQQGMGNLGEMWFNGEISVQQEHFTSALALRRIDTLIAATPPPTRSQTVLTACPPGEWHTFSLVMLNLLIRRRGYHVVYLGGNVPTDRFDEAIESIQPDLVIMASQQLTSAAELQKTARLLNEKRVQIAYGGRVFNCIPALRERIPAHFLGESIDASLKLIDQLLQSPQPLPMVEETPLAYRLMVQRFREKRGLIEMTIIDDLKTHGLSTDYIETANLHLGNELTSALELGDANYLASDMDWLKALLARHNVSPERLNPYLISYRHAVRKAMNDNSTLITNWIDKYVQDDSKNNNK